MAAAHLGRHRTRAHKYKQSYWLYLLCCAVTFHFNLFFSALLLLWNRIVAPPGVGDLVVEPPGHRDLVVEPPGRGDLVVASPGRGDIVVAPPGLGGSRRSTSRARGISSL